jgi:hypothetical protein
MSKRGYFLSLATVARAAVSPSTQATAVASTLLSSTAFYEDTALGTDPDTFDLAGVVWTTNGFVSCRTLVQPGPELLALVEIEMQLSLG